MSAEDRYGLSLTTPSLRAVVLRDLAAVSDGVLSLDASLCWPR